MARSDDKNVEHRGALADRRFTWNTGQSIGGSGQWRELFPQTEASEERIEQVLDAGPPGEPVESRPGLPQRFGNYDHVACLSRRIEGVASLLNAIGLTPVQCDFALNRQNRPR
jgi:hypothetical protein